MRILIVEDEKTLADSIKIGLVDEHFAVDVCYNGTLGYEQAMFEDYDVIILDIMLPGMSGITLCRTLREEKNNTPILMLTAKDTVSDTVAGLDSGADDYLIKPFSFEELLARIRALIRRNGKKSPVLAVDSITLDPATHIVTRKGKEIILTSKEYALLEYFMRNPGSILTREQIISHVWDYSENLLSNIVDVLVKRLREKIDKAFPKEKPVFMTIRGIGYKIK
ncbi:MAG TPA: response regulator transcription factor [Patescibacteria group bacterium]|nr:response regulator transcription factor [Patescibacteria group bacterium]